MAYSQGVVFFFALRLLELKKAVDLLLLIPGGATCYYQQRQRHCHTQ
jgi:hypothetical protein